MALPKTYQYKISTPAGVYLGLLQNVVSEFGYNQNIATTFAQLDITVAQSADIAALPVQNITDEMSVTIQDEAGNNITADPSNVVGSDNANILIQNNNQVQVIEYSTWHPNGIIVFSGYISKWKAVFGASDDITITCISNGQDLDNYFVPGESSVDQSNLITNANVNIFEPNDKGAGFARTGQTFTTGAGITTLLSIELWLAKQTTNQTVTVSVWANPAAFGGTPLGTATMLVNTTGLVGYTFTFPTPITVTPLTQYFFSVQAQDGNGAIVYVQNADVYAGGSEWDAVYGGAGGSTAFSAVTGRDLTFATFFSSTSRAVPYTSRDPTFILNDIMTNYIAAGGQVAVPPVVINQDVQVNFKDATLPMGTIATVMIQTFTPKTNMEIDLMQVYMGLTSGGPTNFSCWLMQGDPTLDTVAYNGSSLSYTKGASNVYLNSNSIGQVSNANIVNFLLPQTNKTNITLLAGVQYYINLNFTVSTNVQVFGASTGEVATDSQVGRAYFANLSGVGSVNPATNNSFPYMYMNIGLIKPFPLSTTLFSAYAATFNSLTYTFKLQTILQAIQVLVGASPANWYWYVDPATNYLQFAQSNTTADFTLIKGRHLSEIDIEATKENIKNVVYFSGGDDGTNTNTNILVQVNAALNGNRVGLQLLSDNRVTSATGSVTAAKLIAQEYINDNASESYITNVVILDSTMDTSTIKLGQVAGFSGFGNFADRLLLQVVGIQRSPDLAILQLGVLPPRPSLAVSQLQSQLISSETGNTSSTPS